MRVRPQVRAYFFRKFHNRRKHAARRSVARHAVNRQIGGRRKPRAVFNVRVRRIFARQRKRRMRFFVGGFQNIQFFPRNMGKQQLVRRKVRASLRRVPVFRHKRPRRRVNSSQFGQIVRYRKPYGAIFRSERRSVRAHTILSFSCASAATYSVL